MSSTSAGRTRLPWLANQTGARWRLKQTRGLVQTTMDSILIRTAEGNDVITIATFNSAMALESEDVALDWVVLRAGVAQALADPTKAFYLLAEVASQPVGQLMVTTEWSDWRNGWIWWIQSVYVKPEHRRRGVFASLYQHLQDMASARGDIRGVRLYVMRDNSIAKRTYESVGMHHSHYDLYETDL